MSTFLIGNKEDSGWISALCERASSTSIWVYMGLTGLGCYLGFDAFWILLGEIVGVIISWKFFAVKFKIASDNAEAVTIIDTYTYIISRNDPIANSRYRSRFVKLLVSFTLIFSAIYICGQVEAIKEILKLWTNSKDHSSAFILCIAVFAYVAVFGYKGVSILNMLQGMIMLFGMLIILIWVITRVNIFNFINDYNLCFIDYPGAENPLNHLLIVLGLMSLGLGVIGMPHLYTRFISVKSVKTIRKSLKIPIIYTILISLSAICTGILGKILLYENNILNFGPLDQNILPALFISQMPLWLCAIVVLGITSAIMSTLDSFVLLGTSLINRHSKLQDNLKLSEAGFNRIGLIVILVIAGVFYFLLNQFNSAISIFWFISFAWSGLAIIYLPVTIFSIYGSLTFKKAVSSCFLGLIILLLLEVGKPFVKFNDIELFPTLLIGLIITITFNLLKNKTSLDK